jgi:hypothetical protein
VLDEQRLGLLEALGLAAAGLLHGAERLAALAVEAVGIGIQRALLGPASDLPRLGRGGLLLFTYDVVVSIHVPCVPAVGVGYSHAICVPTGGTASRSMRGTAAASASASVAPLSRSRRMSVSTGVASSATPLA